MDLELDLLKSSHSETMAGAKKWFKKRSKRIPTKLRVKAEKKLREHNRKVRNMWSQCECVHEVNRSRESASV